MEQEPAMLVGLQETCWLLLPAKSIFTFSPCTMLCMYFFLPSPPTEQAHVYHTYGKPKSFLRGKAKLASRQKNHLGENIITHTQQTQRNLALSVAQQHHHTRN
jgi:hypothetical protein